MKYAIGPLLVLVSLIGLGLPEAIGGAPTTQPRLSAESNVDQILNALDVRGKTLSDFVADVSLTREDTVGGSSTVLKGKVSFQRKGPEDGRILVVFLQKISNDQIIPEDHRYLLDNGWFTERDAEVQKEIRRQVLKPGEKFDPLKLGEGLFPLPIGQDPAEVHRIFEVTKVPPAKDDPPNTVHVQLTPKAGTQYARDFSTIDVWISLANDMPIRIQTVDVNQTTMQTADLSNIRINAGLKASDFELPPLPSGWQSVQESM